MEPNMETVLEKIESENNQLHDSLKDMEAEKQHLYEKNILLEKALEKEKKFHRKFADEVSATEMIRIQDFKKEKGAYIEENKSLIKINRQLVKDVEFYKKAYEELAKDESTVPTSINSPTSESISERRTQSTSTSESQTASNRLPPSLKKMYEENKKLKSKISDINATVAALKRKNKQLENFRNKIEKKKSKFFRDSEELERLVDSSKKKNRDIFTPEVLAMIGNLAKNKK